MVGGEGGELAALPTALVLRMRCRLDPFWYIQIHERLQFRVMPSDLSLPNFVQPDEIVQLRDLQDAALDELLDYFKTGFPIDGAEGLEVPADNGDDDIDAGRQIEEMCDQRGFDVRHVAGDDEREIGSRGGESRVDPDERAADGEPILGNANA